MYQDDPKQEPLENEEEKPYSFSDDDTKKKIKRHLSDINDVITENDIKNVKIPGDEEPKIDPEDVKKEDKKPSAGTEGKPATPWDLVD
jgi:hypothetical protein